VFLLLFLDRKKAISKYVKRNLEESE